MTKCGTRKRTRNTFQLDGVFWQDVVTFCSAFRTGDKLPARVLCPPERGRGLQFAGARSPHTDTYLDMVQ